MDTVEERAKKQVQNKSEEKLKCALTKKKAISAN